jgi:hypothetical protein
MTKRKLDRILLMSKYLVRENIPLTARRLIEESHLCCEPHRLFVNYDVGRVPRSLVDPAECFTLRFLLNYQCPDSEHPRPTGRLLQARQRVLRDYCVYLVPALHDTVLDSLGHADAFGVVHLPLRTRPPRYYVVPGPEWTFGSHSLVTEEWLAVYRLAYFLKVCRLGDLDDPPKDLPSITKLLQGNGRQ